MADEYIVNVVLEGNSTSLESATNRGARSQDRLKQSTQAANIEFLAQVARYQAMTAALNQTIGGINKLAGGLEEIGFEKTAEATRRFTKLLELVAGPAEIYLAYLTLSIALGQKDAATKGAQAAATTGLTAAIKANTVALLANPLFYMAAAILTLIVTLGYLEKEFGKLRGAIEFALQPLERFRDLMEFIQDTVNNTVDAFANFGNTILGRPTESELTSMIKAGA